MFSIFSKWHRQQISCFSILLLITQSGSSLGPISRREYCTTRPRDCKLDLYSEDQSRFTEKKLSAGCVSTCRDTVNVGHDTRLRTSCHSNLALEQQLRSVELRRGASFMFDQLLSTLLTGLRYVIGRR